MRWGVECGQWGHGGCGTGLGLHCRGGIRVHACWDGQGACGNGWNELGWVGIGDYLTSLSLKPLCLKVAKACVQGGCLWGGEGCLGARGWSQH